MLLELCIKVLILQYTLPLSICNPAHVRTPYRIMWQINEFEKKAFRTSSTVTDLSTRPYVYWFSAFKSPSSHFKAVNENPIDI